MGFRSSLSGSMGHPSSPDSKTAAERITNPNLTLRHRYKPDFPSYIFLMVLTVASLQSNTGAGTSDGCVKRQRI